ncbi:MAG: ATP-dependent RecD-like DNA helicase [Eubacteriales bacterium]|jgi:exodeoxyribonuclease V alpha subunit
MEQSVTGTVEHVIYRNEDNGYTVFTMTGSGREITVVGTFEQLSEGENIEVFGRYTEHAAYGRQLRADRYEVRVPETAEAIERYLGSGAIKGIGQALAARIVKKFGDDTLRIIENEPERLAEVRGISERGAREIGARAASQAGMRKAMIFLGNYGISLSLGVRIYKTYGEEMYNILRDNPYRMAEDITGVGFLTADRIAAAIGIEPDSEYRIRSGLLYVLSNAAADGSVYLPENMLIDRAVTLLGTDEDAAGHALLSLAVDRKVVIRNRKRPEGQDDEEERIVYAAGYYQMELSTARMLLDLNVRSDESEEDIEQGLAKLEESGDIRLEPEQKEAVREAARHGVLILTGGPGTGKTTTINEIIHYFRIQKKSVVLAAPTGRAAKRMTEATGYEASTIHRLLEVSSGAEEEGAQVRFERNAENPVEGDVIIIDEMSMVDIFLMHALLEAVSRGTRLILVGDVDQLPSVGPGAVLRDIIRSKAFPCITLTRIFRQATSSDIVVNAHRINRGERIPLGNKSRDFFFLERNDPNLLISNIIELVRDKLPPYVHAKPFDIQVLSPTRKGSVGVERLNRILQQYLNPPCEGRKEKEYGDRVFREGDKVMQTRNNYQLEWEIRGKYGIPSSEGTGIFNGDMGVIQSIDEFSKSMEVVFDDGRTVDYPFSDLDDLEHSYAVTIHKSQGSEYPAVILPLLGGPKMLMTRNLLYTAVTRAKSCVVILGLRRVVEDMIGNETEQQRYTSLNERIEELCVLDE